MHKPKYVIFDCDGVLVDSEIIANTVEAEIKTELGFPTTVEEQIQKFVGLSSNHPILKEELQRLPQNYLEMVDIRVGAKYRTDLKPIPGIIETLHSLKLPKCVASSSALEWIDVKLELTSLKDYFADHLFSGHMVKNGKPAPDLFLYAASRMGWAASDCLVIEDSVAGVTAGRSAGMVVCGFVGGSHIFSGHSERLIHAGANYIISDIRSLLRLT